MRTESDSEIFYAFRNMEGIDYFLYANEFGMSVKRALISNDTETIKPTPETSTTPAPEPPTGGADFKTIKISAIFIQLLLLAELLMM